MVSAWSGVNSLVLAQVKVDDKSNEITAIPNLLDVLELKGCIVTIDAMGCQQEIAESITAKGADYILAVKGNQGFLLDDIKEAFCESKNIESYIDLSQGHGRIEKRTCRIIKDTDWICKEQRWMGLQTLIEIRAKRTIKTTGEKQRKKYVIISAVWLQMPPLSINLSENPLGY